MRPSTGQIVLEAPVAKASGDQNRLAKKLEASAFWALVIVTAFAPLAFGAVEIWSTFVMQTMMSVIAVLLIAQGLVHPGSRSGLQNQALVPAVLFLGLIALQVGFGLTLYRHATYIEFLRVVAYGIGFVAALQLLRHSGRLRQFTLFLAVFGFAMAVFAIAQHFTSPDKLYWWRTPAQAGTIFGPYVNRNHYAGLMEMLTPFAVLGFLVPYTRKEKRVLMLFAAALTSASLALSLSRSGVIAFLVEMIFLACFLALAGSRRRAALGVAALALPLVGLVAWLGSAQLVERFGSMQDWMRLAVYKDGLRMFSSHLALGTGLGTFPFVYPEYRSFATDYFMNQAHNDILQLMIETGIPGLLLVLWFLFVVYRRGLTKAQSWITSWKGAASLAALTGISGILVHSVSDFNLRIPANALLFCILCGVAAARDREKALLIETSPRFRRTAEPHFEGVE